jgi:hypothetical protein
VDGAYSQIATVLQSLSDVCLAPTSGGKAEIAGGPARAKELVWGDWCQDYSLWAGRLVSRLFVMGHLLVRPGCDISSSRPVFARLLRAAAVKGGRRPSRSDLPLTAASTAADLRDRGGLRLATEDDTEGELAIVRADRAPRTCIRPTREDRNHDAVMRIGGEAPRRRVHSKPRYKDHSPTSGCRHLGP